LPAQPEVQTLNRLRALLSQGARALGQAGLVALIVVVVVAGTALAAKGGNSSRHSGGTGTLALVMVEDANADGAPNWNDRVTFAVTASADRPYVSVDCSQAGAWVYTSSAGFFPEYPWPANFTLGSSWWTSGAASCTARLYYANNGGTRTTTLATMTFAVGG
jgi:hypothetical protein